jgi:tetratricopeptide (TPR) repeat protein
MAVGAFAALVLAFMVMRALGIGPAGSLIGKGAFKSKETIVIADFTSPASDTALGVTASEALRTDLAQSSNLKVLTRATVSEVLRLMKKPADSRVPFELAQEVANREGAKAVLNGEISQLGGTYVIAASLVGAQDNKELASFRRTAKSQSDLVEALGALSKDIRSKVGESLRNVHESNPLERVTTSSLPALKKYVEGLEYIAATGDNAKGRLPLIEAVTLDSTFAMAWRRLAASYGTDAGAQALQQHAISQAFKYRDRLSDDERLLTEAGFYDWGPTPDRERAITAYEGLIDRDSTNRAALNNVGNLYSSKLDFVHAEDRYRRASNLEHPFGGAFVNLAATQAAEKKFAAADSTVMRFEKTLPTHGELPAVKGYLMALRGNLEAGDTTLRSAIARTKSPGVRAEVAQFIDDIAVERGRVREGQRWLTQTIVDDAGTPGGSAERLQVALDSAWVQAHFMNDAAAAHATIRRALAQVPMESLAPGDRPWLMLVRIAAATHDGPAAHAYETALEKDLPLSKQAIIVGFREAVRAEVAMAENRPKDALPLAATAYKGDVGRDDTGPIRAQAFDVTDQPDSAIAEFERFVDTADPFMRSKPDFLAGSYKRLGELYETKGNTARAIENYQKFIDLWNDADPELQPAVRSAKARLEELKKKGGKG